MASDAAWRNVYEDTRPRWSYDEDDGYHYGYNDGYSQGYAKGDDDGYDRGYEDGIAEGKASVLQELMEAKKTIKKLERKKKALLKRNLSESAFKHCEGGMRVVWLKSLEAPFRDRDPPTILVEEDVGDFVTIRRCALYLELYHDECRMECAVRMREICKTLLERSIEFDEDYWYEPYFFKPSVCIESRREAAKRLFTKPGFRICSYDKAWLKAIENAPDDLIDIVRDEVTYNKFRDYWDRVPTIRERRDVLLEFFPKDIANKIVSM